ncbi:unnamed protein product [Musa acuminata subsp. burmannicoides]
MLSDDVISSSPSWPPLSDFNGSLFDLSSIMAELPIKRGLSKYFEGKSQSFGSLSDVRCTEDLANEESPRRTKMKTCHGFAGPSPNQRPCDMPSIYSKTTSKKVSRGSCDSVLTRRSFSPMTCCPDLVIRAAVGAVLVVGDAVGVRLAGADGDHDDVTELTK